MKKCILKRIEHFAVVFKESFTVLFLKRRFSKWSVVKYVISFFYVEGGKTLWRKIVE